MVLEELGEAYLSWIHFTPFLRKDGWYGKAEIRVRNLSSGRLDGSVEVEIGKNSFAVLPIVLEGEEEKAFHGGTALSLGGMLVAGVTGALSDNGSIKDSGRSSGRYH